MLAKHLVDQPNRQFGSDSARTGNGRCFGTFGELLQGALPDQERHFLVTLPINQYSIARFIALPTMADIYVFPLHKHKARRLAEELIRIYDLQTGGILYLRSELVEGKGCASSSADMVATARALDSIFRLSLSPEQLAEIMASIEPSDGVMYQGVVSFYHREGVLRDFLGQLPPLIIVAVDEGGQIDTVEFNRQPPSFRPAERLEYERLLCGIEQAITYGDLVSVGEIATRSAIMNQKVLPKIHLDLLLDLSKRYGALGVVVTHSGTYIGLLLDPTSPTYARNLTAIIATITRRCATVSIFNTLSFQTGVANYAL